MSTPSEYLYPILEDIERTVIDLKDEYSFLKDKDIEWCYGQLKDYYRKKSINKPAVEPESNADAKQDLMDEILNRLDERIEDGLDNHLLDSLIDTNGDKAYANSNEVYSVCFNHLIKSVKFWRKNKNAPSYLAHIKANIQ